MSYRIEYHPQEKSSNIRKELRLSRWAMTPVCLAVFLVLVQLFWEEGADLLRMLLIPGDPDVTMEAAETLSRSLAGGTPPGEAISVFCRRILEHGCHN